MANTKKYSLSRKILWFLIFSWLWICFSHSHAQSFRALSQTLGIDQVCLDHNLMSGGVVFFDYNQDHYTDIYLIGCESSNALYRNNWDGTFTNVSVEAGVALPDVNTVGAAVGDIDNDGDDDLFVTTSEQFSNVLLLNNGDGSFTDISHSSGIREKSWSTSATFGDFNLDGWVDIYVVNYADFDRLPFDENITGGLPNYLYQNMGNNTFQEVASSMGLDDIGCGLAVTFTDCDQDGDPDLYVANDFGFNYEPNELYINMHPAPEFVKTASVSGMDAGINAMGIAIGDYDEDGDFDYYVTNMGDNPFFENLDSGRLFNDIGLAKQLNNADGTSWGAAFIDYNNDTYLDLLVANGKVVEAAHQNNENRLFEGNADGNFVNVSEAAGIASSKNCRGLSCGDIDNDGDLDLMFGVVTDSRQSEDNVLIYENLLHQDHHWLKVKLQGTTSNRNGYGSHLQVFIGGRMLLREADGGSSYLSHGAGEIHFGLGTHKTIDSLVITWPGGNRDVIKGVNVNTAITVVEKTNWFTHGHQELSIVNGDSVFLAGAFRKENGVYYHTIARANGLDSALIITRLKVLDQPVPLPGEDKNSNIDFSIAPNPFNSNAKLEYTLFKESRVQLVMLDLLGKETIILEKNQPAGRRTIFFDERKPHSFGYSSGLCIFKLLVDDQMYVLKAWRLNR